MNKYRYLELMSEFQDDPWLGYYYTLTREDNGFPASDCLVEVDRPICCSMKSQLRAFPLAVWKNQKSFESLRAFSQSLGKINQ